ncbi:tol-pal system-associated acyl-CoA thioesterase [Granulosicoccus antarcticus]|uniref:Acyl-CoA thioesterase YbgC n=1 Tax=Granulosicoccus antarcticus IMCC3135 TaxID=1192854 RepID=A0A2Z2P2J4_9GAMM|nr:tol-pal system-associated acyl-CoA thioesterase [Granulosicoccus antarcticus]ASJ75570.1 Acyl-CoA thioesterase YbgC [Granulosicoccus antarcticus IMCC3135]
MSQFSIPIRVYIEDTDAGGIVFYANYLRFMERARTEWLRAGGIELDQLQAEQRRVFVVRSVNIDYLSPARFNDQLTVTSKLLTLKSASAILEQSVLRGDTLLTKSTVVLVYVDIDEMTPCAIPTEIREAINREF